MAKISKIERKVPVQKKRERVAAYARVSMETERLAHSLSAQVSYYNSLIQSNPEWEFAGVYADLGISGTGTARRREWCRLIADCEAGKVDIILTKSISRFARNTVDLLATVRHLKEIGVEVRFEKEHIQSFSGEGELMLSILASFAQEESRSISENAKWGIRKRFQSGEIGAANKHILGYRYQEEHKQYAVIPKEAETVRWIFEMYLAGHSLGKIAGALNGAGLTTVKGCAFSGSSIKAIIGNEIYAGDIRRQKSFMEDPIAKNKVKNRGQLPQYYMADCHQAIIGRETWAKVLAERERRGALANPSYPFTGKIKCGICGRSYTRRSYPAGGKGAVVWFCRAKKEKGITCKAHNYPEGQLRMICAELMGTDGFDEGAFNRTVKGMAALPGGSLEMRFYGGETKRWEIAPRQEGVPAYHIQEGRRQGGKKCDNNPGHAEPLHGGSHQQPEKA